MEPIQNMPVNFFMGGGRYISDKFNMQILDTSNPNCFEGLNLTSLKPDMMTNYIESEKPPEKTEELPQENTPKGIFSTFISYLSANDKKNTE